MFASTMVVLCMMFQMLYHLQEKECIYISSCHVTASLHIRVHVILWTAQVSCFCNLQDSICGDVLNNQQEVLFAAGAVFEASE